MLELTIRNNQLFKNDALNKLTAEMEAAASGMIQNVKIVCVNLAKIEEGKLYKDDGFKSLEEYANTIQLNKSLAHKMAKAGKIYCNPELILLQDMDWSKAALLASEDEDKVKKAVEAGELRADMTQAAVKEWKSSEGKQAKEKVLKMYNYTGTLTELTGKTSHIEVGPTTEADFIDGFFPNMKVDTKILKVAAEGKIPVVRFMTLSESGDYAVYVREEVKPNKKPAKKSEKDMTIEELREQIAKYKALAEAIEAEKAQEAPEATEAPEAKKPRKPRAKKEEE